MTLPELQLAANKSALASALAAAQQADANASAARMQVAQDQNADAMAAAKLAASIKVSAAADDVQARAHVAVTVVQNAVQAAQKLLDDAKPVDLAPLLKAAKPGDTIAPPVVAGEVLNQTIDLKTPNLTIDLADVPLSETPTVGASSDIIVHAPNFTAKRWNVVKASVGFRVYSPNCSILDSHFDGATSEILTGENGVNLLVARCVLGRNFGSVPIYITTNGSQIIDTVFGGSVGEYDLRYDVDSQGRTPVGALVQRCEFFNTAAFGKDSVGLRMIHSMRFLNSKIHGDIRIGQVAKAGFPALTPVDCARDCIIDTCQFDKITRGGAALRIMEGATVTLLNPEFWGDALTDWISIDAGSELVVKNPVLHLPPGVNPKPIVSASATGKWTSDPVKVFNDCTPDRLAA